MPIGTRLTLAGARLLSKALQGKQLKFTRGAFGDAKVNGQLVEPTDEQQDNLNELIHERMSLPIYYFEFGDDGDFTVAVKVKNESLNSTFKAAEAGLFAEDPDTGDEILYGYCFDGNDGDKIHAKNSYCVLEYYVEFTTTIGNAQNVTCLINIKEKIKAGEGLSRAGDTLNVNVGTGLGISQYNNVYLKRATSSEKGGVIITGEDGLIMDGETLKATGGDYESRIRQLEINQSNLYMKLNADYDLGIYSNLLLVEDWVDCDVTDRSEKLCDADKGSVTSKQFDILNDASFAKIGRCYSLVWQGNDRDIQFTDILDGTNQQHERAFIYYFSGDTDDLRDSLPSGTRDIHYPLNNAKIYRTTAGIVPGKYAYGPGNLFRLQICNTRFSGASSTSTQTYNLNTHAGQESNFILSGVAHSAEGTLPIPVYPTFTNDGFFTISL